jgi:SAM-dependent methyltransferase
MAKVKIWNKKNITLKSKVKHFPITSISRTIFSKDYFQNYKEVKKNDKILDIGTYYLNNLLPFKDRGCKLFGVETTKDAVSLSKSLSKKFKIKCSIKLGSNKDLKFKNNYFDFILSLNTIHYEDSLTNINLALKEICRVLKPGGCLILETNAPNHSFKLNAKKYQKNIYIQKNKKDFRFNQKFFYFENKKEIIKIFSNFFHRIEVALVEEKYPKRNLAFFDIKCFKKN